MTREDRNEVLKLYEVSLNAVAQALHRRFNVSLDRMFDMLAVPVCKTSTNRYWRESYNIKAWTDRNDDERLRALDAAEHIYAANLSSLVKEA